MKVIYFFYYFNLGQKHFGSDYVSNIYIYLYVCVCRFLSICVIAIVLISSCEPFWYVYIFLYTLYISMWQGNIHFFIKSYPLIMIFFIL